MAKILSSLCFLMVAILSSSVHTLPLETTSTNGNLSTAKQDIENTNPTPAETYIEQTVIEVLLPAKNKLNDSNITSILNGSSSSNDSSDKEENRPKRDDSLLSVKPTLVNSNATTNEKQSVKNDTKQKTSSEENSSSVESCESSEEQTNKLNGTADNNKSLTLKEKIQQLQTRLVRRRDVTSDRNPPVSNENSAKLQKSDAATSATVVGAANVNTANPVLFVTPSPSPSSSAKSV